MANHKEILRLKSLGLSNAEIAAACGCGRNTVTRTLQRAKSAHRLNGTRCPLMRSRQNSSRTIQIVQCTACRTTNKEMPKSGVTLSLLWVEYCEQCWATGKIPYQATQFNKYNADYVHKTKVTMNLNHKPGETMQVGWAGDTMRSVDTDTGELLPAYLFVSVLPYSGYAYAEAFQDEKQEVWINPQVDAHRFYGGVTRILVPDNLKTSVIKNTKDETVLNRSYREMAEHFGAAVIHPRRK